MIDLFMQITESFHHRLYVYPIPDYFRVVDISKEVSDIVPCRLFRIHPLGQDGQFFYVFFCHIHTNLSFNKRHYHQCHKIKKQDGFNSLFLFEENRCDFQNSLFGVHAFLSLTLPKAPVCLTPI